MQRIRVGGNVQQAKLVNQPKPVYPPLARQARISGVVRFNAIIGTDGRIQNLTLVSGHPLLVPVGPRRREAVGLSADSAERGAGRGRYADRCELHLAVDVYGKG